MTMPAGTYYVGDLCYVMHDRWSEFCDRTITPGNGGVLSGENKMADGTLVAHYSTMYGDGEYLDGEGHVYPVDSGLIGCIRVEDITDPKADLDLGHIHTFNHSFHTGSYDGLLHFDHVCINTFHDDESEHECV